MAWNSAKPASNQTGPARRYERKFLISELIPEEVEAVIRWHPALFSEIYPARFVNSLYCDSSDLKSYFDNVDGVGNRAKVRIRWYGNLFGLVEQPMLELKLKNNLLGRKACFQLAAFSLDADFSVETLHDVFRASLLPEQLRMDVMALDSTLLVRYRRQYFQSVCRRYRVTLDRDLEFRQLTAGRDFLQSAVDRMHIIMEVKYDHDQEYDADRITSHFPFRMTKVSKYVLGLETLNLW